jgi:hypothetical protein
MYRARIMAIGALDQPLFHAMMERLLKIALLFRVARETQRRLLLYQQVLQSGVMHRMTARAGNAVLIVR